MTPSWRFPLGLDEDAWTAIKDAHGLHPDEPVSFLAHRGEEESEEDHEAPVEPLDDSRFEELIDPRVVFARTTSRSANNKRRAFSEDLRTQAKVIRLDRYVADADAEPDDGKRRLPLTRAGCADVPRPCPHVSCRHHLFLEARESNLHYAFGTTDPTDLPEAFSCSLDVAERGPQKLDSLGVLFGLTRERIRQLEARSLVRLKARMLRQGLTFSDMSYPDGPAEVLEDDTSGLQGASSAIRKSTSPASKGLGDWRHQNEQRKAATKAARERK